MSKTSVVFTFPHSLKILSVSCVHLIGNQLGVCTTSWIFLPVKEPFWDVVLSWSLQDVVDSLDLVLGHFSASQVNVYLSDFQGKDGKSSTNTSDLSQTERSFLFTVDVCVLHSENVSEFIWILQY